MYQPGTIEAVAYTGGQEIGRVCLASAQGSVMLNVQAERATVQAGEADLAYVNIALCDKDGIPFNNTDCLVTLEVQGAELLALGSAKPAHTESYQDTEHTTFDGRALAILRPLEEGEIDVTVSAEGFESKTVKLMAE